MEKFTDEELVARSKDGERNAFEELVKRYQGRIYHLALKMLRDPADAEDVLQKSFLSAYQNINKFRGDSKFHTWLFRIASNFALMKLRQDKGEKLMYLDEPISVEGGHISKDVIDWKTNPEEIYQKEELKKILEDGIAELPEPYRIVFILRDIEGLSNNDVAKMLDISLPAVKSRLIRARMKMRDFLTPYFNGGQQSAAVPRDSVRTV